MVGKEVCPVCSGSGLHVVVTGSGDRYAEECACRAAERMVLRLHRANIPRRYEHCTLQSYESVFRGCDPSLLPAHFGASKFVEDFPERTEGRGLLFVGTVGLGKTHLAVAILRALITEKQVRGLFCDYRDLLKQIQNSYNPQVATTEMELLRPVFNAEVLVLDELGATKPTEWVWDTVAHILNTRYNDKRTTIITTNYADLPAGSAQQAAGQQGRAVREESLGDRIGERMRSRLAEMCVTVNLRGDDFRRTIGRARFEFSEAMEANL
jgi:DNA replication protein DnaC